MYMMKNFRIRQMAMVMTLLLCEAYLFAAPTVNWRCSIVNNLWQDRGALTVQNSGTVATSITADTSIKGQTMDGFGGAFNELGWKAMMTLSQRLRDSVIKELFDTATGCNLAINRMPLGASDFATSYYSLNDNAGDYAMANFSIQRDRTYLIPFIKAAMAVNPRLKVWGSPWTPPSWMKTNNNYAGGSITQNAQTLSAYALYFEKAVQAYRADGLDFVALSFQNEPYANQVFPSCLWNGTQIRDFIKLYLGPKFQTDNVGCQIWSPTMNNGDINEFLPMLTDAVCYNYLTGCCFQWAGEGAVAEVHRRYPNIKIWQTEVKCGGGENNWTYATSPVFGDMCFYFAHGANSFMQWNMILDQTNLSHWGWSQCAMVTADTTNKRVVFNPQLYAVKHFTNYVRAGARRVKAAGTGIDSLQDFSVFRNPGGQIVVVFKNPNTAATQVGIKWGASMVVPQVPGSSFNTITITEPVSIRENKQLPVNRNTQALAITRVNGILRISTPVGNYALRILSPNGRTVQNLGSSISSIRAVSCASLKGLFLVEAKKGTQRIIQKALFY